MSLGPAVDEHLVRVREQISRTEAQLYQLRLQLLQAEQRLAAAGGPDALTDARHPESSASVPAGSPSRHGWPLSPEEYKRYGRQLIMPEIGLAGQLRLKGAKVLIVGVGGLGCPAAAYLGGAGVGTLGLVDGDEVEVSNLHRQILHNAARVGVSKVHSAYEYLNDLNPWVTYERHPFHLSPQSALSLFARYDLVLDCTDHPTSRYLISDACVLAGKPLVSASALRTEGQLIVLNHPSRPPGDAHGGPCYRCIFPKPPPAESVLSCGEGGILGPVVGVMGVLQALEAIKTLTESSETARPTLLMYSAYDQPPFRSIRMRGRHKSCAACSATASITADSLTTASLDYVAFCGTTAVADVLDPASRVTASQYAQVTAQAGQHTLIDVRDATQFALCALPGAVNVPWNGSAESWAVDAIGSGALEGQGDCYVVCRFGNDSQLAAQALQRQAQLRHIHVRDVKGGLEAWRREVDGRWPEY